MSKKSSRSFAGDVWVNAIFALFPIGITLVSVPLYIAQIGLERYGILTLVWSLTGMFAFFDFGMGSATTYLVARARGGLDGPSTGTVILTTGLVNLILGGVLGLIFWLVIGPLVFGNIKSSSELMAEIAAAMGWIAVLLPLGLVTSILRNALDGQRRFMIGNLIGTSGQVATVLGALAIAYMLGPEMEHLVAAVLVARLIVLGLYMLALRASLGSGRLMSWEEFRETVRFGGWQTVFSGLSGLGGAADRFVIGWVTGASATALYAIPLSFTARLRFLPQAVLRSLFPRLAEAKSEEDRRNLSIRALTAAMAAMSLVTIPAILIVRPFFGVWLGPEYVGSSGVIAQVLLVAIYVQSCLRVLFVAQRAAGRPDLPARLRMVSSLPFVALLILMVWWFGALGAALALLVRFLAEIVWVLRASSLLVNSGPAMASFVAVCGLAMLVAEAGYGIVTGVALAGASAAGLGLVAVRLSPDLARLQARIFQFPF